MQEKKSKTFVDPELTARIRKLVGKKIAVARFAGEIGASPEAVRLWYEGKSKPSTDWLIIINEKTKTSIDWLLTGDNQKAPYTDRLAHDMLETVLICADHATAETVRGIIANEYNKANEGGYMKEEMKEIRERMKKLEKQNEELISRLMTSATRKTGSVK